MGAWKVLTLAWIIIISNCHSEPTTVISNTPYTSYDPNGIFLQDPHTKRVSNCICFPKTEIDNLVPNELKPDGGELERLIVYLYRDRSNNKVWIYAPNHSIQNAMPDLIHDEESLLIPSDKQTIDELMFSTTTTQKQIFPLDKTSTVIEPGIYETFDLRQNVTSPESYNLQNETKDQRAENPFKVLSHGFKNIDNNFNTGHLSDKPNIFNNILGNQISTSPLEVVQSPYMFQNNFSSQYYQNDAAPNLNSYSQYYSIPNLRQSLQFPINDMMNMKHYFLFSSMHARSLRDQVIRILQTNNISWSVPDLLTNINSIPKLALVPILKQDSENQQNEKSWQLLVLLVNRSNQPRILGTIFLGKMELPPKFNLVPPCRQCGLFSPCNSEKCFQNSYMGHTFRNLQKFAIGRKTNRNKDKYKKNIRKLTNTKQKKKEMNPIHSETENIEISQESKIPTLYIKHMKTHPLHLNSGAKVLNGINRHIKKNLASLGSEYPIYDKNENNSEEKMDEEYHKRQMSATLADTEKKNISHEKKQSEEGERNGLWKLLGNKTFRSIGGKILKNMISSKMSLPKLDFNLGIEGKTIENIANIITPQDENDVHESRTPIRNKTKLTNKPVSSGKKHIYKHHFKDNMPEMKPRGGRNKSSKKKYTKNEEHDQYSDNEINRMMDIYSDILRNKGIDKRTAKSLNKEITKYLPSPTMHSEQSMETKDFANDKTIEFRKRLKPEIKSIPRTFLWRRTRKYIDDSLQNPVSIREHDRHFYKFDPKKINSENYFDETYQEDLGEFSHEAYSDDKISQEIDESRSKEKVKHRKKLPEIKIQTPVKVQTLDNIDESLTDDEDDLGTRILGGNAATSSGTPVVSRGRSGLQYLAS